ncbi:MAG: hypothetical protein ACI4B5_07060 [Bacteroidaceae bacterium]
MTSVTQGTLFGEELQDTPSPLEGRVVCMLGTFTQSNATMQRKLRELGADYKPSTRVSRNVHYVLLGHGAPQDQIDYLKTLAFNGYHPRVLSQQDWDKLQSGKWEEYRTPMVIEKHLHITLQHFLSRQVDYSARMNPLYTHELYVAPDTETPQEELYQLLGNRGIYANPYIDEETDVLVISEHTLENLHKGVTDDILQSIENTYNASRAQQYRYVMTTERQLMQWLRF